MKGIRHLAAGIALGSALLSPVLAATPAPAPLPPKPPAEWAEYIAAARKADAVVDDEARCRAYPDLPGNQWRPGAAFGRCSILRKPAWSLEDIDRLLATREGVAELEAGFTRLLDAHYADQSQRDQIFVTYAIFDAGEHAGRVAQRWLDAAPGSAFAKVALATHYETLGWNARGADYAFKTSEGQFQGMTGWFAKAVPLYLQVVEAQPRLSVACNNLHGIGRQSSDALQQYAAAVCRKVDPDSYYLSLGWIKAAEPKWGGSDEELRAAVAYAAARTERNPMLGALLGEAAGYRPLQADDAGKAADDVAAAARMGPSAGLSEWAGRGYQENEQQWLALVYLSQATRFRPGKASVRMALAQVIYDILRDPQWARMHMEAAVRLEPENSRYTFHLGRVVESIEGAAGARQYYRQAMKGDLRQPAKEHYCQTFGALRSDLAEWERCTAELVASFPDSAESWRQRAWVLYTQGQPGMADAVDRFARLANPDYPFHREQLEWMRREWAGALVSDRQRAGKAAAPDAGR